MCAMSRSPSLGLDGSHQYHDLALVRTTEAMSSSLPRQLRLLVPLMTLMVAANFLSYYFIVPRHAPSQRNDVTTGKPAPRKSAPKDPVDFDSGEDEAKPVENSVLPLQNNPWIESVPLDESTGHRATAASCPFRQFDNHTVYSRGIFVDQYADYKKCAQSPELAATDVWLQHKVFAETGPRGEIRVRTNHDFDVNVDSKRLRCDTLSLLFVVLSRRRNHTERNAVRRTWATEFSAANVTRKHVLFFVGRAKGASGDEEESKFDQERRLHSDLIVTEVVEDSEAFEVKQMHAVLSWVHRYCSEARFIVRTDDTTFINVRRFDLLVEQELYAANRIYGNLMKRMEPDRSAKGEHHVAKEAWPWKHFPPFVEGPTYVMSSDVISRLLVAAKRVPVFPLEQVYFTGLVPLANHVMRIGVKDFFEARVPEKPRPSPFLLTEDEDALCAFARHGAIGGVTSYTQMEAIWRDVKDVQEDRNKTCTVGTDCVAKVEGKCILFANKKKKRKHRTSPVG